MKQTEYKVDGRTLCVLLESEIDHHHVKDIIDEIRRKGNMNFSKNIVFDFSKVNFMDSSAIGLMMEAYKRTSCVGGNVLVKNISMRGYRAFQMAGILKFISVEDSNSDWDKCYALSLVGRDLDSVGDTKQIEI